MDCNGGKCYILVMKKALLKDRKRIWRRFEKWEAQEKASIKNPLHLIGEWVDFFLSKHPKHLDRLSVRGIAKMRRSLSYIPHSK